MPGKEVPLIRSNLKKSLALFGVLFTLASCNLINPDGTGIPLPAPGGGSGSGSTPTTPTPDPPVGSGICSETPGVDQCLGLKFVAYRQSTDTDPTLDEIQAIALVNGMNRIWQSCGIGFTLERFETVNPADLRLNFSPDWRTEGEIVRATFADPTRMLIVAVGPWSTSTIAVTQMPGTGPYGVLVEQDYATNPLTVGHELGHYMGLYHYRDTSNLMNPYIGSGTEALLSSQCAIARDTNVKTWGEMMR